MVKTLDEEKIACIFIGIQASGKSSYYHCFYNDFVHINLDTLHTRNKENILLMECIENEKSFVVDNTNPTVQDREKYIEIAKSNGYRVWGYYFCSAIEECKQRNLQREGKAKVPDKALACTHNKLELPKYEEGFDKLYYVHIENGSFITEDQL